MESIELYACTRIRLWGMPWVNYESWATLNHNKADKHKLTEILDILMTVFEDWIPEENTSLVFIPVYYLPLLYLYTTMIKFLSDGDDDRLLFGFLIPSIGLLFGLIYHRWEFFRGFLTQLSLCIPIGIFAYILGYSGLIEDGLFGDLKNQMHLYVVPFLFLPIFFHSKTMHTQAFGAACAIPVAAIVTGVLTTMGSINRFGFW